MVKVTLPDGGIREFEGAVSAFDVASDISKSLAKQCILAEVNGELVDMKRKFSSDFSLELIKADNEDPRALEVIRHSAAHVLAEAICTLFPGTKLAYGPATKDGFFYDLATPEGNPISNDDFKKIEKQMEQIVRQNRPFVRHECNQEDGLARVEGDKYKTDNAERAIAKGAQCLSFYSTGEEGSFEDLCSGPHLPSTGHLKAFTVTAVSGAYWHGDQNSDQLTRVYGTAFADKKALKSYLHMIEEAKKRDHRLIGKEMNLFSICEDNPGNIFWHPNGWTMYQAAVGYVREKIKGYGYCEVSTPMPMPRGLWERSGHWAKYRDNMFITKEKHDDEEARVYALKPMNCPGHTLIYSHLVQSYRDLPLRMAEFGTVARHEPTGALHGIFRCRTFTQDDAHIFCTEEQVADEIINCCEQVKELYSAFGYDTDTIKVKFSTRPEERIGSDESWDAAEAALEGACQKAGLKYEISPGEGAFYGPKLEFTLVDCLGREWQCGTVQVDYLLASEDRLNVSYVGADNEKHRPVIIHRALLGSLERFLGITIEHYAGKLPLWLSPEQVRILQITDKQMDYADELRSLLLKAGIRATADKHADKLGAKIRRARNARVPYFLVIGAEEMENRTVAVQRQNGDKVGVYPIDEFVAMLKEELGEHA